MPEDKLSMPSEGAYRGRNKRIVVAICVVVGALHFVTGPGYAGPFKLFVNGYMIDILLPFAMFLLLGIADIEFLRGTLPRSMTVFCAGAVAETLQYFGVGLFGQTFDPLDYLMFVVGIVCGVVFETRVLSRLGRAGIGKHG